MVVGCKIICQLKLATGNEKSKYFQKCFTIVFSRKNIYIDNKCVSKLSLRMLKLSISLKKSYIFITLFYSTKHDR